MVTSRSVPGGALTPLVLAALGCLLSVFLANAVVAGAPVARARVVAPNAGGNLTLMGQIAGAANAVVLNAAGDRAYLAVGPRLMVLDASAPRQLRRLGQSEVLDGVVTRLAVAGDHVFAGNADGGVWVLTVVTPTATAPSDPITCRPCFSDTSIPTASWTSYRSRTARWYSSSLPPIAV